MPYWRPVNLQESLRYVSLRHNINILSYLCSVHLASQHTTS